MEAVVWLNAFIDLVAMHRHSTYFACGTSGLNLSFAYSLKHHQEESLKKILK